MSSIARRASCLLLALGAAACARTEPEDSRADAPLPDRLAGCYALFHRSGRPASDSLYFAPSHVRLDTVTRGRRGGAPVWALARLGTRLRPLAHDRTTGREVFAWAAAGPDSVRLTFSNGSSGTTLTLPARSDTDTLRGRAIERWDFGPTQTDGGSVTAVRVPCRAHAAAG